MIVETQVEIATPTMLSRILGPSRDLQPLKVATPAAVVIPPTFAFDATNNLLVSKPRNLPIPRTNIR